MPIFCVLLVRRAKRISWRFARARSAWANSTRCPSLRSNRNVSDLTLQAAWCARIVAPLPVARVAELADAYGSGPYGETRGGSSPLASSKPRSQIALQLEAE